jgi:cytochrome c oxidase subunit 1
MWDLEGEFPVMTGLRVDQKEMILTTVVTATPDLREPIPYPSLWPFISAVAVGIVFVASIFSPWAIAFGVVPCGIAFAAWFWPKELKREPEPVIT